MENGNHSSNTNDDEQQAPVAGIEAQRAKAGLFFREDVAPGLVLEMVLKHIYHTSRSQFQEISVVETFFGRTLVTDGKTQSTQFDEFTYHESLVHPPLLNFTSRKGSRPKTVFIGGGGELATAREVLRHSSVEKCLMVDLDGMSFCWVPPYCTFCCIRNLLFFLLSFSFLETTLTKLIYSVFLRPTPSRYFRGGR